MAKSIIVGYDPKSSDFAPVAFALQAARFTGAPLIVASAGSQAEYDGRAEQALDHSARVALDEIQENLDAEGVAVERLEIESTSAARALHEAAEERDAGLLVVGSTSRGAAGRV